MREKTFKLKSSVFIGLVFLFTGIVAAAPKSGAESKPSPHERGSAKTLTRIAKEAIPAVAYIVSLKEDKKPTFTELRNAGAGFFKALRMKLARALTDRYHLENAGSGFLISNRGFVLTNYHVVKNADMIEVKIDGHEWEAMILGADPVADIALLKMRAWYKYKTLPMGDSSKLEIGETVIAIGNPFGLGGSFTVGIVSGLRRDEVGLLPVEDFIQTDTAINPGNSGGPLINIRGEVIGINTAVQEEGAGVGFAIPINMVRNLLPRLVAREIITHGALSIAVADITPELAETLRLKVKKGVLVKKVPSNSAASRAGIKPGDVITDFNGSSVAGYRQIRKALFPMSAGDTVRVGIARNGKKLTINAVLDKVEAPR